MLICFNYKTNSIITIIMQHAYPYIDTQPLCQPFH